jgi:hypothetical protein
MKVDNVKYSLRSDNTQAQYVPRLVPFTVSIAVAICGDNRILFRIRHDFWLSEHKGDQEDGQETKREMLCDSYVSFLETTISSYRHGGSQLLGPTIALGLLLQQSVAPYV